jgi:hypothetical protein
VDNLAWIFEGKEIELVSCVEIEDMLKLVNAVLENGYTKTGESGNTKKVGMPRKFAIGNENPVLLKEILKVSHN